MWYFFQQWSSSFYWMCVGVTWITSLILLIHLQVWRQCKTLFSKACDVLICEVLTVAQWLVLYTIHADQMQSCCIQGLFVSLCTVFLGERLGVPLVIQEEKWVSTSCRATWISKTQYTRCYPAIGWCTIYQFNSKSRAMSQRTQQWSLFLTQ